MDFYDETTAIFWTLYYFAILVIPGYDRIKAMHSISKKLFFFEGTKYINNAKMKKLKDILNSNEIKESKNIEVKAKEEEIDEDIIYTRTQKTKEFIVNKESRKQSLKLGDINNENKKNDVLIDYSNYNLFEIIASFDIFCKTKKFKKKLYLYEQAENIINEKLDVIYYIRNMILFELINKIYLENDEIINFLSRPIIYYSSSDKKSEFSFGDIASNKSENSLNQSKNKENGEQKKDEEKPKGLSELYKSAYHLKSNILYKNIEDLIQNEEKTQSESKIVELLEKHLEYIE